MGLPHGFFWTQRKKKRKGKDTDMMQGNEFVVYTDGGCQTNPGGAGGLGAVIRSVETGEQLEICEGYLASTNNRMEILAVVRALSQLPRGAKVELYSDSEYVLKTAKGEFKERKNQDLWKQLHAVMDDKKMTFHWVRGHQGNPLNERCDELATRGQRMPERQADTGYVPEEAESAQKNGHAARAEESGREWQADVPEDYAAYPEIMSPEAYAEKYSVNPRCAKAIQGFAAEKRRSFSAYSSLRTDGMDAWSRRPKNVLEDMIKPDVWKLAGELLPDSSEFLAAMRWHCRGLSLKDAVQKTLVDAELARRNMFQKKGRHF